MRPNCRNVEIAKPKKVVRDRIDGELYLQNSFLQILIYILRYAEPSSRFNKVTLKKRVKNGSNLAL